jgi:hypothetical protein
VAIFFACFSHSILIPLTFVFIVVLNIYNLKKEDRRKKMSEIFSLKKEKGKTSLSLSINVFNFLGEAMGIDTGELTDFYRKKIRENIYKIMHEAIAKFHDSKYFKEIYSSSYLESDVLWATKELLTNKKDFKLEMEQDGV